MHVLIVKEDSEVFTKITYEIKTCLKSVVSIQHRILHDANHDEHVVKCDKVIFLLTNNEESKETAYREWIGKYPNIRNTPNKFLMIQLERFHNFKKEVKDSEDSEHEQSQEIRVSDLEKDIFQWWPKVLEFLFGRESVGNWYMAKLNPNWRKFCVHCVPNREEIAHPLTREILSMLQTFGASKVGHTEPKQCCLIICKEASIHLTPSLKSELECTEKSVQLFGIALSKTNFSDEMIRLTDRCFTRQNLLSLILILLSNLRLINAKFDYKSVGRQNTRLTAPSLILWIAASLVFLLNLPALLIQIAIALFLPWPLVIVAFTKKNNENQLKFINYGLIISSIVVLVVSIVTEMVLYPNFSEYPIYAMAGIYLLIWQFGFGLILFERYHFRYGIYSIPSRILNMTRKKTKVWPDD